MKGLEIRKHGGGRIVDISRLFDSRPRACGHTDDLGNPDCTRQGRYGLYDDRVLIRCRCRQHMAELSDD